MQEVVIGLIALLGVYLIYKAIVFLSKKGFFKFEKKQKKERIKKTEKHKKHLDNAGTVAIVDRYMYTREVNVLIALNKVLPKEFIALPKVGVANLVVPEGTRNLFNEIKEYFVDFVIFDEKTMKPVLVVDVYDNSFDDELLRHRHPDLIEVFEDLKLKLIEIVVRGDIDLAALKTKLFEQLGLTDN